MEGKRNAALALATIAGVTGTIGAAFFKNESFFWLSVALMSLAALLAIIVIPLVFLFDRIRLIAKNLMTSAKRMVTGRYKSLRRFFLSKYADFVWKLTGPVTNEIQDRLDSLARDGAAGTSNWLADLGAEWKAVDDWWVSNSPQNWEKGSDISLTGREAGLILNTKALTQHCRLDLDVRIERKRRNCEISFVFSDAILMFFEKGFRVDTLVSANFRERRRGDLIPSEAPILGQTYKIAIVKTQGKCTFSVNGRRQASFDSYGTFSPPTRDRFGLGHMNCRAEFRNVQLSKLG